MTTQDIVERDLRENCLKIIKGVFPKLSIEPKLYYAAGGLLGEIVGPEFDDDKRQRSQLDLMEKIVEYNQQQKDPSFIIVFHRLFVYQLDREQYRTHGTLHTRVSDYQGGIPTTYLNAGDAYVWIAEVDAQAVLYGIECPFKCRAIPDTTLSPILQISKDERYVEVEFEGNHFLINPSDVVVTTTDICITLSANKPY